MTVAREIPAYSGLYSLLLFFGVKREDADSSVLLQDSTLAMRQQSDISPSACCPLALKSSCLPGHSSQQEAWEAWAMCVMTVQSLPDRLAKADAALV